MYKLFLSICTAKKPFGRIQRRTKMWRDFEKFFLIAIDFSNYDIIGVASTICDKYYQFSCGRHFKCGMTFVGIQ